MNNTKRIVSLILSVILVLGVVVAMSSCKKHEHTFEAGWTTDPTNHWHKATCEHTDEKGDLAAHADADNDGVCDVCDYAMRSNPIGGDQKPAGSTSVTYTVTVKNSKGEAVPGVKVRMVAKANEDDIKGDYVPAKTTDAEGKVTFDLGDSSWSAQIESAPEGYASETEHDDELNLDFVKKYSFGSSNALEIVLVDAPAAVE